MLKKDCKVQYEQLFPYNAISMLKILPADLRINLGTEDFALQIKEYFYLQCQHAQSRTVKTCTRCVKDAMFNTQIFPRNQPVFFEHSPYYKDGLYYNWARKNETTWASLFKHHLIERKRRIQIVNEGLRGLRKGSVVPWSKFLGKYANI